MLIVFGLLSGLLLAYCNLKLSAQVDKEAEPKWWSYFAWLVAIGAVLVALRFTPTEFSMSMILAWLVPFFVIEIRRQT